MPDEVVVGQPFCRIEEDSESVGHAPTENPEQPRKLDMEPKKTNGEQRQPSHAKVGQDREPLMLQAAQYFERNAKDRQTPDHTKKRPTPNTAHGSKCKGRIGAGNQNVDRRMIKQ